MGIRLIVRHLGSGSRISLWFREKFYGRSEELSENHIPAQTGKPMNYERSVDAGVLNLQYF